MTAGYFLEGGPGALRQGWDDHFRQYLLRLKGGGEYAQEELGDGDEAFGLAALRPHLRVEGQH